VRKKITDEILQAVSAGKALMPPEARQEVIMSLRNRVSEVWRNLPGSEIAESQFKRVEASVLRELKARLEAVEVPAPGRRSPRRKSGLTLVEPSNNPSEILAGLLSRSTAQDQADAYNELFLHLLRQMVPDEARILATLSDGTAYPLLHVGLGTPIGPVTRRIADNFSNVGKISRIQLPAHLPHYIAHLRELGLVEEGPELKAQDVQYQILEGDGVVRQAIAPAERQSRLAVRYIRRSLVITPLGRMLWETCAPGRD
jgi:hypothetical protein